MEYLIVILVVAVALAPLSHFVPSKRQRAVARMREHAAVSGLFVEFRQLPSSDSPSRGAPDPAIDGIIYYGKRLAPARGGSPVRGRWLRQDGIWRSLKGPVPVPPMLEELPAGVLAASADEGSCGIYWRESGGEPEVEQIVEVISRWADSLRPQQN